MRLIDADALKETTESHGEKIAYVVSFLWDVDAAPTIDAIPVEWLRSQMHDDPNDIESAYDDFCIGELIEKWQKEQEDE